MSKIDLRKQIKKRMDSLNISIPAMARQIGCNHQTLYDFFGNKRKSLGANYLEAILNELNAILIFH